jgi:hypothetical protein
VAAFIRPTDLIPNLGKTFGDFWSWAYSDVLSNSNRSVFAEYLVGCALDAVQNPRVEWDRCDLSYRNKLIEVKASAYVQSWPQARLSTISFDIGPHRGWDAATNSSCKEPVRCADCYVFCLFSDRERQSCDVTDISRWRFYIVMSDVLNSRFGMQKRAGLGSIEKVARPVLFETIRHQVDRLIAPDSGDVRSGVECGLGELPV